MDQLQSFGTLENHLQEAVLQSNRYLTRIRNNDGFTSIEQNNGLSFNRLDTEPLFSNDENIAVSLHIPGTKYDQGTSNIQRPKKLHNHDFYEMNYIYRGGITNCLPDTSFHQDTNTILLMNPFAFHTPILDDEATLLFNIVVRRAFSSSLFGGTIIGNANFSNLFLNSSLGMSPMKPYMLFEITPIIRFLLHQMIQEYFDHKPYYQQVLVSNFIQLCSLFIRQKNEKSMQKNKLNQYPQDLEQMINYIRDNYASVSLESVSKHFGFSISHLSSYIQKYTGYKFKDIVHNFKMQNAAVLLLHTDYTLSEIINQIGYNDVSYFSKIFKNQFGVSPGKFRYQERLSKLS